MSQSVERQGRSWVVKKIETAPGTDSMAFDGQPITHEAAEKTEQLPPPQYQEIKDIYSTTLTKLLTLIRPSDVNNGETVRMMEESTDPQLERNNLEDQFKASELRTQLQAMMESGEEKQTTTSEDGWTTYRTFHKRTRPEGSEMLIDISKEGNPYTIMMEYRQLPDTEVIDLQVYKWVDSDIRFMFEENVRTHLVLTPMRHSIELTNIHGVKPDEQKMEWVKGMFDNKLNFLYISWHGVKPQDFQPPAE